jgi:hypothetical protein
LVVNHFVVADPIARRVDLRPDGAGLLQGAPDLERTRRHEVVELTLELLPGLRRQLPVRIRTETERSGLLPHAVQLVGFAFDLFEEDWGHRRGCARPIENSVTDTVGSLLVKSSSWLQYWGFR